MGKKADTLNLFFLTSDTLNLDIKNSNKLCGGLGNHPLFQTKTIFPKTFLVFVTKICFNKENDKNSLICFENFNIFGHFFIGGS